jgi:xanthine dehydrogenase accessory factor
VSGAIQRLNWAGFPVIVTELSKPLVVRRLVAFANAVYEGNCEIEGTPARLVDSLAQAKSYIDSVGGVPVIVDPNANILEELKPAIIVDGRMAKTPLDAEIGLASITISLGPGHEIGIHCDAIVETKGGSQCGYAYFQGSSIENTGLPCNSSGYREERVIRAPRAGLFELIKDIGGMVEANEIVGKVDGEPIRAEISGVLRGMLHDGLDVQEGLKIGDIDHRGESSDCCRVSEKADSVATGVMEAIIRLGLEKSIFADQLVGSGAIK